MFKTLRIFAACLVVSGAAFAQPQVLGMFQTKPDLGGARNKLCAEKDDTGQLKVAIATAYCPTKICLNMRQDGMLFTAPLVSNAVQYSAKPGCSVRVQFSRGGAMVSRNTKSCMAEHPYFFAEGWYEFVTKTPDAASCKSVP
jgi:hypothetical protein